MAAAEIGGGNKVTETNITSGCKSASAPYPIGSTVETIETPIGSKFSAENQLDPYANDLLLPQRVPQKPSSASNTTTGTDTIDMNSAPW